MAVTAAAVKREAARIRTTREQSARAQADRRDREQRQRDEREAERTLRAAQAGANRKVMDAAEAAARKNDPVIDLTYTHGDEFLKVHVPDIVSGDPVRRQSTINNLGKILHGLNLHRTAAIAQIRAEAIGKKVAAPPISLKTLAVHLADETRHADTITFEVGRSKR